MPIKDPERKRAVTKAWREKVMPQGYGRWLYQRRKLRFQDAEEFRAALIAISALLPPDERSEGSLGAEIGTIADLALDASRQREEDLGPWTPPEEQNDSS